MYSAVETALVWILLIGPTANTAPVVVAKYASELDCRQAVMEIKRQLGPIRNKVVCIRSEIAR